MGYIGQAPTNKVITSADIEDGIVVASDIAADSITLAKMASGTDGNVISYDASGNPVAIATGSDGQVLTSAGAGQPPAFESVSAGTSLSGSTNNTVATVTGANALIGEANLLFDGTNLGVGGTPVADRKVKIFGTASNKALVVANSGDQYAYATFVGNNTTDDGQVRFGACDDAAIIMAGNAVALRITDAQKVGIGESSPLGQLHVKTADSGASVNGEADELVIEGSGYSGMTILSGTSEAGAIMFGDSGDNGIGRVLYDHSGNALQFHTSGAEAVRIDSTGDLQVGTTASDSSRLHVEKDLDGWFVEYLRNTSDTASDCHMAYWHFVNVAHDNNVDDFLRAKDSSAERMTITCDGDLFNHDNAYGALSDERIKQDIRDSNSQWDDIKALRVRNFKKKDDVRQYGENAWEQIGLIAQEVEASGMDKLIRKNKVGACDILSSSEFGTLYTEQDKIDGLIPDDRVVGDVKTETDQVKSIVYSVVQMKALKALQEAMEKIEILEAKVTALENA